MQSVKYDSKIKLKLL